MDLANAIVELWARKLLVLLALLMACAIGILLAYDVRLSPFSLQAESVQVGSAETTVLLDTRIPSAATLAADGTHDPFVTLALQRRAQSLARLMGQRAIKERIAEQLGIRAGEIGVTLPVDPTRLGLPRVEPGGGARASQIVAAADAYQLTIEDSTQAPTIRMVAQAPTAARAVALADGAADALATFVEETQARALARRRELRRSLRAARRQLENAQTQEATDSARTRVERLKDQAGSLGLSARSEVTVRRLSRADGGTITQGANRQIAIAGAVVSFVVLCVVILVGTGAARTLRAVSLERRGAARQDSPPPSGTDGTGDGATNGDHRAGEREPDQDAPALPRTRGRA